jgi:hypothetical protein
MPPFHFFRAPSLFWSTPETAGPSLLDVLRIWDREPRPLRPQGRSRPRPFHGWATPEILTDASELATFWRSHYGGSDWTLDAEPSWITTLIAEPSTLVLGVREGGRRVRIVGSIVCRRITGPTGRFRLGTKEIPTAYVIEGLCIHPSWRGQHLAGWLIAWIDHLMNTRAPQAFFWSREAPPQNLTYVASHTYGYIPCSLSQPGSSDPSDELVAVSWPEFQRVWASYIPRWEFLSEVAFPTTLPADPLLVWRSGANYIVVSDTRRRMRSHNGQGEAIWEVQFCGDLYEPNKGIVGTEGGSRRLLETVAAQLNGLLFVTSAPWQGGCTSAWPQPWVVGTSGVHTTYIYNYMPPTFHNLCTLFLRNEI